MNYRRWSEDLFYQEDFMGDDEDPNFYDFGFNQEAIIALVEELYLAKNPDKERAFKALYYLCSMHNMPAWAEELCEAGEESLTGVN